MNLKKIKCVVLDFDGTMYSDGDWDFMVADYVQFMQEHNIFPECKTSAEKVERLDELYPQYHMIQQMFAYFRDNNLDDSDFRKFFEDDICEIRCDTIRFIESKLIDDLSKNYKVYIISDSSVPYLEFYLDYAEIDKRKFDAILSNEYNDEGFTKIPMMRKILAETGLKPDEVIMIGDSEKSDIVPAKLVGFQTCHVKHVSETEKMLKKLIRIKNSKV